MLRAEFANDLSNAYTPVDMTFRFIHLILVATGISSVAHAATNRAFECDQPPSAQLSNQEIVKKIQRAYQAVNHLKARFIQDSYLASLDTSESSGGDVWFSKPGKMRWLYHYPEKQMFVVSDQKLWFYQPAENQATVDTLKNVLLSDLPVGFLMGIGDLDRDFDVKSACFASSGLVVEFLPKSKESPKDASHDTEKTEQLKGFILLVDRSTYLPKGSEVLDVAGNVTSILLEDLVSNGVNNNALFSPTFPKGTDITDRSQSSPPSS